MTAIFAATISPIKSYVIKRLKIKIKIKIKIKVKIKIKRFARNKLPSTKHTGKIVARLTSAIRIRIPFPQMSRPGSIRHPRALQNIPREIPSNPSPHHPRFPGASSQSHCW